MALSLYTKREGYADVVNIHLHKQKFGFHGRHFNYNEVYKIEAEGVEKERIEYLFSNLPQARMHRKVTYLGEMAKFIAANLEMVDL